MGWVEFEPTVAQPALVRPQGGNADNNSAEPTKDVSSVRNLGDKPPGVSPNNPNLAIGASNKTSYLLLGGIIGLVVILALLVIPTIRRRKIYEKIPPISIILEKSFRKFGLQPPHTLLFWAQRAALSPLARAYLEINLALARIGKHPRPTDTPAERVTTLVDEIPPASGPAQQLLSQYQLATYSQAVPTDVEKASRAGTEIRQLSYKVYFRKLLNRD